MTECVGIMQKMPSVFVQTHQSVAEEKNVIYWNTQSKPKLSSYSLCKDCNPVICLLLR